MTASPLIEVRSLSKHYPIRKGTLFPKRVGTLEAVDDVSFDIYPGETIGLVGESGAGKSTLGLMILGLLTPTSGTVSFEGRDIRDLSRSDVREIHRQMQIIFQDPFSSFNPRLPVATSIELPLRNFGWDSETDRRNRVLELLEIVGLNPSHADRYPHQFSGGQAQRLGIARALALQPRFIVLDEPVSALDVSIQAQILNLLADLQSEFGLTFLFIANSLSVVHHVSDRVAVMYRGAIVEMGTRDRVFYDTQHEHTKALLSSILTLDDAGRGGQIT